MLDFDHYGMFKQECYASGDRGLEVSAHLAPDCKAKEAGQAPQHQIDAAADAEEYSCTWEITASLAFCTLIATSTQGCLCICGLCGAECQLLSPQAVLLSDPLQTMVS